MEKNTCVFEDHVCNKSFTLSSEIMDGNDSTSVALESDSDCNSEAEEFFFESDHLAFRGNADYTSVLRTLAILQTQKIQAANDIEKLAKAEKSALENPEEFIKKLSRGEIDGLPGPITIAELPKINFEKYGVAIPEFVEEPQPNASNDITVRGRVFDQTKPETFNQLWTCEEQRRLEELLIEYPPEPVERRRFAKIARALGNRTTKQVASRLQKYFKKLHSAGMPIPGRIPKSNRCYIFSKQTRIAKHALRPTTFFPANYVPVTINDDDDVSGGVTLDPNWYRQGCSTNSICSDVDTTKMMIVDEDSDTETKDDNISQMVRLLVRVKRDKEKDLTLERGHSEHDGFKCDFCGEEPIIGTRWHCNVCIQESTDFCSDCVVSQLYSDKHHPASHKLVGIRVTNTQMPSRVVSDDGSGNDDEYADDEKPQINSNNAYDKDYMIHKFSKTNYNYLDPNFLPE